MYDLLPVNRMAALHVSQQGCSETVYMNHIEMVEHRNKLQSEYDNIKRQLGIRNTVNLKNIKHRINKGKNCKTERNAPEEVTRLRSIGNRIAFINDQISEMKKKAHLRRHWNVIFGVVYERSLVFTKR